MEKTSYFEKVLGPISSLLGRAEDNSNFQIWDP